ESHRSDRYARHRIVPQPFAAIFQQISEPRRHAQDQEDQFSWSGGFFHQPPPTAMRSRSSAVVKLGVSVIVSAMMRQNNISPRALANPFAFEARSDLFHHLRTYPSTAGPRSRPRRRRHLLN